MIEVAFADLTHTGKKVDATYAPLAVAGIASYLVGQMGDQVSARLFKYPHDLAQWLEEHTPAIVAFSNYCWNEDISTHFAETIRRCRPEIVIVMGGPNYFYSAAEQKEFLAARPAIDFYVSGEAEEAFVELFRALQAVDFSATRLKAANHALPNVQFLSTDGVLVRGEMLPRMSGLDRIPSPYLTGLMDRFFDDYLTPMIQTARGCPYACTFCHDGLPYMTKYQRYSLDRVKAEIEYIRERRKTAMLCIVDDNFGIHAEDEEIAKVLAEHRRREGWPNYINYGGTAKNNKERIIRISRELSGAIEAGASVQSTSPEVLKQVKRTNISMEAIATMAREVAKNGITSYSEIILCLPGDTKGHHMQSVYDMIDLGIQNLNLFQFVVLPGTEGASEEHRRRYGYHTKWRVFPRCIGHYKAFGQQFSAAEISEVCVGNNTLPPEEYTECRKFDLTVGIFFNGGVFDELYRFLDHRGIKRSEFLATIHRRVTTDFPAMVNIFNWFTANEKLSLFETAAGIRAFLAQPGSIERYISGDLGINQIMHGRAMALSTNFDEIVNGTFAIAADLLAARGVLEEAGRLYLDELLRLIHARKGRLFQIIPPNISHYHFDFVKLAKGGFLDDPYAHMVPEGLELMVDHSSTKKEDVRSFQRQFGPSIDGISHFLQRSAIRNVYRDVGYAHK